MKAFYKISVTMLAVAFSVGLAGPHTAFAVTTPSLGLATTYGVLAGTYTNTSAATTINGDVGFTTGPLVAPLGVHTNYGSGAPYPVAHTTDAATALTSLNTGPCDFNFGSVQDLSLLAQPLTPGVYCIAAAASIGTGGITLNGAGTYIFRITGAFTTADNSVVNLNGASPCDVFWAPTAATTLGATTTFAGTIIDNANAITVGANTVWTGRAISLGAGTVTTGGTSTITTPVCVATTIPVTRLNTITIIKNVINDSGGTATYTDFPLFLNNNPLISGQSISAVSGIYQVSETSMPNYQTTFSGDCNASGQINHGGINAHNSICIITNNDVGTPAVPLVPPLISVLKVPNPLALPSGPGPVTYTYSLRNIGTVPVTNITMVGDTCSPIVLNSGDSNSNSKLDLVETWVYSCTTTLTATHTNTVVATGWANGISAVDSASATVVVGVPVVPPLIHVTKVPNPLTLRAAGGTITYTETITNPGTIALSNVQLTDDKCSPLAYASGDTNGDNKLDITESWRYTCRTHLSETTVNTATASGDANGLTARDVAIATVVVATPSFPNTGLPPTGSLAMLLGLIGVTIASLIALFRKRTS